MWPDEGAEAVRRVLSSTDARHLVNSTGDLHARLDQWVYRKSLQPQVRDRQLTYYARPALANPYVSANSTIEKRITRVFQDVLGIEKVGLEDNFFDLGGNSLISLQVLAELQREFAIQLSPTLILSTRWRHYSGSPR
jgi:acyl carrier protein